MCSPFQLNVAKRQLDMTIPYSQICLTFLVPKPQLLSSETYILQPLQKCTWIAYCIFILGMALILYLFASTYKNIILKEKGVAYLEFSNALFTMIRISTLVSLPNFPKAFEFVFRLLLSICYFTALMVSTGYSGGFTSSLTYPRYFFI